MKRKGPRTVPDFSRKPKAKPGAPQADANVPPPPPPPADRLPKPTSMKSGNSGRRGG